MTVLEGILGGSKKSPKKSTSKSASKSASKSPVKTTAKKMTVCDKKKEALRKLMLKQKQAHKKRLAVRRRGGELDFAGVLNTLANASTSSNIDNMIGLSNARASAGGSRGGSRGGARGGVRGGYESSMEVQGGSRGGARGGYESLMEVQGGSRGGARRPHPRRRRPRPHGGYQQEVIGGFYEMLETFQEQEEQQVSGGSRGGRGSKGGFYDMLVSMEEFANKHKEKMVHPTPTLAGGRK